MRLEWQSTREVNGLVRSFTLAIEIEGNDAKHAERATRMLKSAALDLEPEMVPNVRGPFITCGECHRPPAECVCPPGTSTGKGLGEIDV